MIKKLNQKQLLFLISAGLVLATFIAYEPIRHNSFVSLDDQAYIALNKNPAGGITLQSVIDEFTGTCLGNWHPLTMLSHKLDCWLFGLNPLGHHLVSVAIHMLNALLLFWILANITGEIWPSSFVAAIFALHPLQVEAVAWASERKTVLSGLFWFLTIAVYIWYAKKPGTWRYILVFVIYTLCIMTKPVVVTLPFVLILLDYWPLNRINNLELKGEIHNSKFSILNSFYEKIPLLVLSLILSIITFIVQRNSGAIMPSEGLPLAYRVANMFLSYIKYIGKMLWPEPLVVYYPYSKVNLSSATVILCAVLFILLSAVFIYAGRRKKYMFTGWLWYAGTLIPMIGLVQAGSQAMADRYMYLSILGLMIIVAWGVKEFVGNRPGRKTIMSISATMILLSAIFAARLQVRTWQNGISLFEHALKFTRNNYIAEGGYGNELYTAGRLDEAELHLKNSIRLSPGYYTGLLGLSKVYLKQNKPEEAIIYLNEILSRKKDSAKVYFYLGCAFKMQQKYDEAIKWFDKALELDPSYFYARDEMGAALMASGMVDKAILCFEKSLQINPNRSHTYMMLGVIYKNTGDYKSAISNLTRAVELSHDNTAALNLLAWLLATTGDVSAENANKAVKLAVRACELTGYKEATILDTLAAAYAASGRFSDAIKTANESIDIAKTNQQEILVNEIQNRIKLYQDGRRYYQK